MRTSSVLALLLGVVAACDTASLGAQELDAHTRARVDSVFVRYDRTDTPGCAVLVRRDGRTAYARGYGMASLELGVAITPQTVMDIGSTSKQSTAAAICCSTPVAGATTSIRRTAPGGLVEPR